MKSEQECDSSTWRDYWEARSVLVALVEPCNS